MSERGKNIPGRFLKGISGNPLGRPKGSKNQITMMKIALEGDLRTQLRKDAVAVLAKAVDLALTGDTSMIKLLVDKMIPTSRSVDDEPTKERVQIFIDRLRDERPPLVGSQNDGLAIQGRVLQEATLSLEGV